MPPTYDATYEAPTMEVKQESPGGKKNLDAKQIKDTLGSLNYLKDSSDPAKSQEAEVALNMYASMDRDEKASFLADFAIKAVGKGKNKDLSWCKGWQEEACGYKNQKTESTEDFMTR